MQIRTGYTSANNTTFHVMIMGKHVAFICGLEVKTTKVDDHQFTQCTCFSDRFEERTNKKPHCTCIMYIQWLLKQLFKSEIC